MSVIYSGKAFNFGYAYILGSLIIYLNPKDFTNRKDQITLPAMFPSPELGRKTNKQTKKGVFYVTIKASTGFLQSCNYQKSLNKFIRVIRKETKPTGK